MTLVIFAGLAVAFAAAAVLKLARGAGFSHPQIRTRLLVAAIFSAVSLWLWSQA